MTISTQILSVVIIVFIGVLLLRMLYLRAIKEKYMWVWLFLDALALVFTLWPTGLSTIGRFLGFTVPSNMVFFVVIAVLVIMEIYQAMAISRLEEDRRRLTEEVAILRNDIESLK